jgi:hypothetical protein
MRPKSVFPLGVLAVLLGAVSIAAAWPPNERDPAGWVALVIGMVATALAVLGLLCALWESIGAMRARSKLEPRERRSLVGSHRCGTVKGQEVFSSTVCSRCHHPPCPHCWPCKLCDHDGCACYGDCVYPDVPHLFTKNGAAWFNEP